MCSDSVIENRNVLIMLVSMQVFRPAKLTDKYLCTKNAKIQQSLYRSGQALRVPGGLDSQI
jgi:hypothetical protein